MRKPPACAASRGERSPTFGLLLDTMRHVQEHTAQLNLILGQQTGWNPKWDTSARHTNEP